MKKDNIFFAVQPHKKRYNVNTATLSNGISSTDKNIQEDTREPRLKCRYIVVLFGFLSFLILNAYRLNMSVGIVAMVNNSAISERTAVKSESCPNLVTNATKDDISQKDNIWEGEFLWSPKLQGYVLGSMYLGFIILQVPAGVLSERFGAKWLLFYASFVAALCTLLIPVISSLSVFGLVSLQTLRGIAQGLMQPAVSVLSANWFPKMERGLLYSTIFSGLPLGSFAGSALTGFLCESLGWPSSFYALGVAGVIISIFIAFFLFESPTDHPRISKEELEYIISNQENVLSRRRPNLPWGKILTSVPIYALAFAVFGQLWAIFQFLTVYSTFLGTILHYPIKQNGFFSAVPFILQFLFSHIGSWLSRYMSRRKMVGIDGLRKFWNFIASLGFSLCLLGVYFAGCNRTLSIAFAMISVGFIGFGFSGSCIVAADMSPTFAGSIHGITCAIGATSGFIIPLVVGYLTNEMQIIEQWNKVTFISVGVVMSSAIVFVFFGSAEVQPWNYVQEEKSDKEDSKVTRF